MSSIIDNVKGRAVAVRGNDIDTDRIMPARFLKCVTFDDLGRHAFEDERTTPDGRPKPHPFNEPARQGSSILVVNKNFGCGSSREHAPQGILRWGIRAIVGETFAEIFAGNCAAIGLVAATASEADVRALMDYVDAHPEAEVSLDVKAKTVSFGGRSINVDIKESARKGFLEGTWDTTATLLAGADAARRTVDRLPYTAWFRAARAGA